jgi:site-specific DNA-methyltransferase (adenine-specific)
MTRQQIIEPINKTFDEILGSVAKYSRDKSKDHFQSKIITGDIIKTLASLDPKYEFDVIIADPPYNIGKDFGNNKDNMELKEYVKWSEEWIALCFKLLAKNGIIYIYGFSEILARISVKYPVDKQRWLAWHYTNKTTPSSTFWQRSHESILCLWKNERPLLEIDQIREPYTENYLKAAGKKRANTNGRFGNKETTYKVHENGALPRDVINIPALAGGAGKAERWFMCKTCKKEIFRPSELKKHKKHDILQHPTQKPMELTKRLIQSCINGNDGRTLIPFAGSGSECVVADSLNIEYIGIELNPEYVQYARKWISASRK